MLRLIFMIPLLQMLVLVFAATFDLKNIDLCLIDKDHSLQSKELISKINGSPFFTINFETESDEIGMMHLRKGESDMTLVIPSGFSNKLNKEKKRKPSGSC